MQLDDTFFSSLGRELTEDQKQTISQNIYGELEDRVGEQLASQISDQQYEEFEALVSKGDDIAVDDWLAKNAPGHEQLVDSTLEQIKLDAKNNLDKYL